MHADHNLTETQAEVLAKVLEITNELGCPPTAALVIKAMGRNVRSTLRDLRLMGYLHHPFDGAPLVAARRVNGTPLELRLVERQSA